MEKTKARFSNINIFNLLIQEGALTVKETEDGLGLEGRGIFHILGNYNIEEKIDYVQDSMLKYNKKGILYWSTREVSTKDKIKFKIKMDVPDIVKKNYPNITFIPVSNTNDKISTGNLQW